jgi:hypothetical protein
LKRRITALLPAASAVTIALAVTGVASAHAAVPVA